MDIDEFLKEYRCYDCHAENCDCDCEECGSTLRNDLEKIINEHSKKVRQELEADVITLLNAKDWSMTRPELIKFFEEYFKHRE